MVSCWIFQKNYNDPQKPPKKVNIRQCGHIGYDQQVLPNPLKSANCDSNILVSEVILK